LKKRGLIQQNPPPTASNDFFETIAFCMKNEVPQPANRRPRVVLGPVG
jgi:hypothetical protein